MQRTVTKTSLTLEAAQTVLTAALAAAEQAGVSLCIAVTDETGTPIALSRMDGAGAVTLEAAMNKAFTAAALGRATHELFAFMQQNLAYLTVISAQPRMLLLGGGVPLRWNGQVVGAIGVSGGVPSRDESGNLREPDVEVAQAGAAAFAE